MLKPCAPDDVVTDGAALRVEITLVLDSDSRQLAHACRRAIV